MSDFGYVNECLPPSRKPLIKLLLQFCPDSMIFFHSRTLLLNRIQMKLHFVDDMIKKKIKYTGHVLRGTSGLSHTSSATRGYSETKNESGCSKKNLDEGYVLMDKSGFI